MNFTVTEITLIITTLLGVGGWILQMRTTSFSQFVKINEILTARIVALETSAESKDKRIDSLERQIDNYERWMTSAIAEIKRLGGTPPEWHKS